MYRAGDPETPGVTAFLERVGAAFDVTIRVYQDDMLSHVMELYYLGQRPFGEAELARAEQLAGLLTTVISRERLTRELEQAETRFRTLVQQIPAIPYIVEEGLCVVFSTSHMDELVGRRPGQAQDFDDWRMAVHEDDRERAVRQLRPAPCDRRALRRGVPAGRPRRRGALVPRPRHPAARRAGRTGRARTG